MNNVPTVSDTKRAFYNAHTRPINSIYRRVVEELLVEMHLLSVNDNFTYDPLFALGVVTSFDRFMDGYRPEADRTSIFSALCQALQQSPDTYRRDAETMLQAVSDVELGSLLGWLQGENSLAPEPLQGVLNAIAHRPTFKYSRLFGVGLFTILEKVDATLLKQKTEERIKLLQPVTDHLNLPLDKLQKDLETYASNLEKMAQAKIVMEEAVQAERKKREQREQERKAKAAATDAPPASDTPDQAVS